MTYKSGSKSRWLIWGALAAFSLFIVPVGEVAWAKAQGGTLVGFVYAQDLKTPVTGAVVKVRNIANQKEYASGLTDANGMYKIEGIDEGRYVLGVTAPAGDFNFDYAMTLKGGEMAKLSVGLAPGKPAENNGSGKKSFFNSTAGFLIMMSVGGALFWLAVSGGGEASPIR